MWITKRGAIGDELFKDVWRVCCDSMNIIALGLLGDLFVVYLVSSPLKAEIVKNKEI